MSGLPQIELLAPAGDAESFKAALAAGADAVYFGLEQFSARTRAKNISIEELQQLAPLAKKAGARLYLALNTLLLDEELESALRLVAQALGCGVDAIIVQDLGALSAIKAAFPRAELHASTQMTSHNTAQCAFLAQLGVSQINLSRELPLGEVRRLAHFLHGRNITPEVFVHGAYCISFSGQCYFSGALYGEHGNRGSCVQPCRRSFANAEGGSQNEMLAPFCLKDNSAFALARELAECAPLSLKIEGRIKNAEYVWAVTGAWREQLGRVRRGEKLPQSCAALEGAINRGYSCSYLRGKADAQMFSGGEKDLSLAFCAEVVSFNAAQGVLAVQNAESCGRTHGFLRGERLCVQSKSGAFVANLQVEEVLGGAVGGAKGRSLCRVRIVGRLAGKILKGQRVFYSRSVVAPQELAAVLRSFEAQNAPAAAKIPLAVKLQGECGGFLRAEFSATCGGTRLRAEVLSAARLEKAHGAGLCAKSAAEKLGKLGGTAFALAESSDEALARGLFIPPAQLNAMRREAVAKLNALVAEVSVPAPKAEEPCVVFCEPLPGAERPPKCGMAFVCTKLGDAEALLGAGKTVVLELPLEWNGETEAFLLANPAVVPAFGAILFEEDLKRAAALLERIAANAAREPPFVWCENSGLALAAKTLGLKSVLGPRLNITNSLAAQCFRRELGMSAFVPSAEISAQSVAALRVPEGCELWMPLFAAELLMQSRQCLVRAASGCTKSECDRECILHCEKSCELRGRQGERIQAQKRRGFYSALYVQNLASNAALVPLLDDAVCRWFADLRFLPDKRQSYDVAKIAVQAEEALCALQRLPKGKSPSAAALAQIPLPQELAPFEVRKHFIGGRKGLF